ncbi:MAG: hypothetical protein FWD13_00645 [Treponema sp.]|nr:hypothetical protein [Treponema sp.]
MMIINKLLIVVFFLCASFFGCIESKDCNLLPESTGKLTITDIPEEHIGKYIWVDLYLNNLSSNSSSRAFGITRASILYPNTNYYLNKILDEKVNIPLYEIDNDNPNKYYAFNFNGTSNYSIFACILSEIEYLNIYDATRLLASITIKEETPIVNIDDFIYIPIVISGNFINGNFTISWIKTGIEEDE